MKTFHSSLEPLEARIAPAATILVDLTGGNLSLTSDANDTQIQITPGPGGTLQLFSGGSLFDFVDPSLTDVMTQTFVKITGSVAVTFQNTTDSLNIQDVKLPKNLTINGGNGSNAISLTNTAIGGDFVVNGGTDADAVSLAGVRVTVGGNTVLTLGDGSNSLNGGANTIKVGKNFTYTGGTGADTVASLGVGVADLKGNVSIDLGASGTGAASLGAANLKVGGALSIKGGSGIDTLTMQPALAKIGKDFTVDLAGERNNINILAFDSLVVGGAVAFTHGANPSMTKTQTQFISSGKLTIGKGLTITHGDGYFDTTVRGTVVQIGGAVQVTQGNHDDNAVNFVTLSGLTSLTTKGALSVTNGDGVHSIGIYGTNLLSVGGATTITHGNHTTGTVSIDVLSTFTADLKGDVTVLGGNGESSTSFNGVEKLNLGGKLSVTNGTGGDLVLVKGERTTIKGKVDLQPGVGASTVAFTAVANLAIGGDVIFTPISGATANLSMQVGAGSIGGTLGVNSPTTTTTNITLISKFAPLVIKKQLDLDTESATGNVLIQLSGLTVTGTTRLNGSAEVTDVAIDDVTFGGTFTADLGAGADSILIEKNATIPGKVTTFMSDVSILLGDTDNDLLTIGINGNPALRAVFKKLAVFDGGAGNGDNLILANATFLLAGQPTSTGF